MSFQQKYLKYKSKYLLLKNQVGGDLLNIFNILVSREVPGRNFYFNQDKTKMIAGYLSINNYENNNWTVLDNTEFTTWCQTLVGGQAMDDELAEKTCNELWQFFLAHFEDLVSNDTVPIKVNEKNPRYKLLRRWSEYFINNLLTPDMNSKSDITDEELREIFCNIFKKAVQDTIRLKGDAVLPTYPLQYLFYSIFRNF
jgi:hypothetical protein